MGHVVSGLVAALLLGLHHVLSRQPRRWPGAVVPALVTTGFVVLLIDDRVHGIQPVLLLVLGLASTGWMWDDVHRGARRRRSPVAEQ